MNLRPAFLVAGLFAAAVASAANPVGNWVGHIQIKMPAFPPNTPPAQKEMATKMLNQFKAAKIFLTLKADKTYTVKTTGIPTAPNKGNEKGTWSQAGNVITMKENKPGGKPQPFNLSADGKKLSMSLPGGQGQITFTR